jgi:hypothetical protein
MSTRCQKMGDLDGHDLRQGTVEGMGLQLNKTMD